MPSWIADHLESIPLVRALDRTPIPTAPPAPDSYREALGLALLDLALRLNHVERLSESLELVDSTHMARSVEVDVNLHLLTSEQRRALAPVNSRSVEEAATRTATLPATATTAAADAGRESNAQAPLWIPLARQSRKDLAPIVVRDSAGTVLPRLTHFETSRALKQGLARVFRMFLDADQRSENSQENKEAKELLYEIRHVRNRSRWLIEAAIGELVERGSPLRQTGSLHWLHHDDEPRDESAADRRRLWLRPDNIRWAAAKAIGQLFPADSPFFKLLDVASSEYLLVVLVDSAKDAVYVKYDAPLMPAKGNRKPGWRQFGREFTVRYSTVIPRAVNSYHITVRVPEEIQLRRFLLSSDVDSPVVDALAADMTAIADSYTAARTTSPKLLELELQSVASRLSEIGRRRSADLVTYKQYLCDYYKTFTSRQPWFRPGLRPSTDADGLTRLVAERRFVQSLDGFAASYQSNHYRKLVDSRLDAPTLRRLADRLSDHQVKQDIYVDNDPRENGAHAHWRRRSFGAHEQSSEPVQINVFAALVDDPPSLASSVSRLLLALFVLCLGAGVLLDPGILPWRVPGLSGWHAVGKEPDAPLGSADALVTVLLLVPGLLVTRLDIPSRKTVLGQLRVFPQYLAYTALTITSALALITAVEPSESLPGLFRTAIILLFILFLISLLDWVARIVRRRRFLPSHEVVPEWLWREVARTPELGRRQRPCTVEFSNMGPASSV